MKKKKKFLLLLLLLQIYPEKMSLKIHAFLADLGLKEVNDGVYYGVWAANGAIVQVSAAPRYLVTARAAYALEIHHQLSCLHIFKHKMHRQK